MFKAPFMTMKPESFLLSAGVKTALASLQGPTHCGHYLLTVLALLLRDEGNVLTNNPFSYTLSVQLHS